MIPHPSGHGAAEQRAATDWLRASTSWLDALPLPGRGETARRWRTLSDIAAGDLARARLAEGHVDARAILAELDAPAGAGTWGVWAAQPTKLLAERTGGGWHLHGEKDWCSGATGLDHALVSATGPDGPRLFVIEPTQAEVVPGSWPSLAMAATASCTMRFDATVDGDAAIGGPDAYVRRAGFWHGGAGVAACWYGGCRGVAARLQRAVGEGADATVCAAWGRVDARLEAASALLARTAAEIDDDPRDVIAARRAALRLRIVVEDAAQVTMAETMSALGAGALAHDPEHAQRIGDLQLYVRQLRTGPAAAELGTLTGSTVRP